jgi:hypothetical protein
VFLQNYQVPGIFGINEFFSIGNSVDGPSTGSMAAGARVHGLSLNESRRLTDQGPGLAQSKGYDDF